MTKMRSRRAGAPLRTTPSWLEVAGLGLLVAKVVLVPLVFDPDAAQGFALPKSSISRALLYPTVLVLAVYVFAYRAGRPRGAIPLSIACYGVVATLSAILAFHIPTAVYGAHGRYLGLTSVLDGILLAIAIMVFVRSTRDAAWVLGGISVATAGVIAYALVQVAGVDPFKWGQAASTLGNSGAMSGLIASGVATSGAVLALRWKTLGRSLRAALGFVVSGGTAAILLVGTRSATLALPIAVIAIGVIWCLARQPWPRISRSRSRLAIGGGLFAVAATGVGIIVMRSPAFARVLALVQGGDLSSSERGLIYRAAFDAFLSRPFLGVGPDGFITVYPSVRPVGIAEFSGAAMQSSTHSWFLHHLVGTGAIGLTALLIVVGLAIWSGLRRARDLAPAVGAVGLATYLAQGAFSINHVGTDWLFWAFVGLTSAIAVPADGPRPRDRWRPLSGSGERAATIAALALGLALASTTVASLEASHSVLLSNRARSAGDLAGAVRSAQRATALDSGRADNWNTLGLAYARDPERGAEAFRRAHEAAPYDPVYLLNLSRAEASLAEGSAPRRTAALAHAQQAAEMDTNNPDVQQQAARILWSLGDLAGAIARIERALQLTPRPEDLRLLAADIYESAGRLSEAARWLEVHLAAAEAAGNPSLEQRRRLARLYYNVGDRTKLDQALPPPRVAEVTTCSAVCMLIRFESVEDLRTDESRGSALRIDNYEVRGSPLPIGSRADLRDRLLVMLTFPSGYLPVAPGDVVQIANVEDAYGRPLDPNPTFIRTR